MERIGLDCEVITPMFISGANLRIPELRVPSLKGALRFWWRAMKNASNVEELRKEEQRIFGGTQGEEACRSNVIMKIRDFELTPHSRKLPSEPTETNIKGKNKKIDILEYLLYGIHEYNTGLNRDYINPGTNFTLEIMLKDISIKEEVLEALSYFQDYGSLGAKGRNGFGCIKINGLSRDPVEFSKLTDLRNYSSFSKHSRVFKTKQSHKSWNEALAEIGIAYKNARCSLEESYNYEKRQYIASPIVVMKSQKSKYERYSKPYFLHISREKDEYQGKILFLPSNYAAGLEEDSIKQISEHKKYISICKEMNSKLVKEGLEEVNYG